MKTQPTWSKVLDRHLKVSWAQVASKMDMTEGGIRHWRNGSRQIKFTEFIRLCKAAGVDPVVILREAEAEDEQLSKRPVSKMLAARKAL